MTANILTNNKNKLVLDATIIKVIIILNLYH